MRAGGARGLNREELRAKDGEELRAQDAQKAGRAESDMLGTVPCETRAPTATSVKTGGRQAAGPNQHVCPGRGSFGHSSALLPTR